MLIIRAAQLRALAQARHHRFKHQLECHLTALSPNPFPAEQLEPFLQLASESGFETEEDSASLAEFVYLFSGHLEVAKLPIVIQNTVYAYKVSPQTKLAQLEVLARSGVKPALEQEEYTD